MKAVVIITFFLIFGISFGQETTANSKAELYALNVPETYEMDEQVYSFTPEVNKIRITKLNNKEELEFGELRKTTDDGLYIMTSTFTEEVSFGRFDSTGNFKTLRYDPKTDSVLEENYIIKKVKTQLSSKK